MYNDAALSVPSDYVFVLDWGYHWVTSAPGSIDEYAWFKKVAEYTATMPNLGKFVLGMPLYGVDWPAGGGQEHPGTALEYAAVMELASSLGVTPEWEAAALSPHFSYTAADGVRPGLERHQQSLQARGARGLARDEGWALAPRALGPDDLGAPAARREGRRRTLRALADERPRLALALTLAAMLLGARLLRSLARLPPAPREECGWERTRRAGAGVLLAGAPGILR